MIIVAIGLMMIGAGCNTKISQSKPDVQLPNDKTIVFVGQGCTHCEIVADKIYGNPKFSSIDVREVFHNQDNAAMLVKAIQTCNLNFSTAGVPLLWDGRTCVQGDEKIIKLLNDLPTN